MKADIKAADRGEPTSLMDPLLIGDGSRHRPALTDLAFDLPQKSAGHEMLLRTPHQGHDTHPIELKDFRGGRRTQFQRYIRTFALTC